MTQSQLKWLAIIIMVIDHSGLLIFQGTEAYMPMRIVGRLAFPIFCFLIVEGFYHTRNIYKYMGRLAVFAILSEIPFDLMLFVDEISFRTMSLPQILNIFIYNQNVMWTLLFGLFTIWLGDKFKDKLFHIPVVMAGMIIAEIFRTDYGALGILMIYFFYLFPVGRKDDEYGDLTFQKIKLIICQAAFNLAGGAVQTAGIVSLLPIFTYRGEKGKWKLKYFFYAFYPLHMLILAGIHFLMFYR